MCCKSYQKGEPCLLTRPRKAGAFPSRAKPKRVRDVVYKEELQADKTLEYDCLYVRSLHKKRCNYLNFLFFT